MEKIQIGQIVNAVGLKGEVKIYNYSNAKERYEELDYIYANQDKYEIENVRYMKETVILKLKGINDRNTAEAMKTKGVYIDESQLEELPEGSYYIRDIIGFNVADEKGIKIGILNDVLQNTAQDLYEIKGENGNKILIPGVEEFILDIDLDKKCIKVRLIEGMLELNEN